MNLREAFDKWAKANNYDMEPVRDTYRQLSTACAYEAFQAGAAHAARECAMIAMNMPAIDERDGIHKYRSEDTAKALAWDTNIAIRKAFLEAFK